MAIQVKNRLVGRRNSHVISHKSHPRFDPWWANMFFENMIIKPSICLWLDWKGMIKHDLNICFFGLARFLLVTRGWHKIKKEINLIWVHYVLYFKQPKGKVYRINSCGGNEYSHQSFPAKKSFFHTDGLLTISLTCIVPTYLPTFLPTYIPTYFLASAYLTKLFSETQLFFKWPFLESNYLFLSFLYS